MRRLTSGLWADHVPIPALCTCDSGPSDGLSPQSDQNGKGPAPGSYSTDLSNTTVNPAYSYTPFALVRIFAMSAVWAN